MTPLLRAEWRHLLMLNFSVDPELLGPLVPSGTELDTWRGRTYVSLVGFLFLRTKLYGLPIPLHQLFEEVNLRFYVKREASEGTRRGVVFIKEIVPKRAVAVGARWLYGEPYVVLPTEHHIDPCTGEGPRRIEYRWNLSGTWNAMSARVVGRPEPMAPGSDEEFIAEHYWGYTRLSPTRSREYRVEHPPWSVSRVENPRVEWDAESLYGKAMGEALDREPTSGFLAEGSPVSVYMHTPLDT